MVSLVQSTCAWGEVVAVHASPTAVRGEGFRELDGDHAPAPRPMQRDRHAPTRKRFWHSTMKPGPCMGKAMPCWMRPTHAARGGRKGGWGVAAGEGCPAAGHPWGAAPNRAANTKLRHGPCQGQSAEMERLIDRGGCRLGAAMQVGWPQRDNARRKPVGGLGAWASVGEGGTGMWSRSPLPEPADGSGMDGAPQTSCGGSPRRPGSHDPRTLTPSRPPAFVQGNTTNCTQAMHYWYDLEQPLYNYSTPGLQLVARDFTQGAGCCLAWPGLILGTKEGPPCFWAWLWTWPGARRSGLG